MCQDKTKGNHHEKCMLYYIHIIFLVIEYRDFTRLKINNIKIHNRRE